MKALASNGSADARICGLDARGHSFTGVRCG
jgi:hypothetical protein